MIESYIPAAAIACALVLLRTITDNLSTCTTVLVTDTIEGVIWTAAEEEKIDTVVCPTDFPLSCAPVKAATVTSLEVNDTSEDI